MSESLIFFERIAHSLIFGQQMSDSLGKPMSKIPALEFFGVSECDLVTNEDAIFQYQYDACDQFCMPK